MRVLDSCDVGTKKEKFPRLKHTLLGVNLNQLLCISVETLKYKNIHEGILFYILIRLIRLKKRCSFQTFKQIKYNNTNLHNFDSNCILFHVNGIVLYCINIEVDMPGENVKF